ncbi:hypothetical protein J1605_007778 [Eschrichtius robustus]|uniref:Uncharacterized protein n=1 Tax=Eschrichtius robustus TaxID=9764 RepID=A0AB34GWN2_ESCRO|nr:hypothetical protein J1605_007778 [Eschrichtius robustus]
MLLWSSISDGGEMAQDISDNRKEQSGLLAANPMKALCQKEKQGEFSDKALHFEVLWMSQGRCSRRPPEPLSPTFGPTHQGPRLTPGRPWQWGNQLFPS